MDKINFNISPYTFAGSAFLVGLVVANELSSLEQVSVGNWLQLVGLTIQTYSSQSDVLKQNKNDDSNEELAKIKKAITLIEKELTRIKNK